MASARLLVSCARASTHTRGCVELSAATPSLRRNQRVRIIEGPFAGHEALFYAHRSEDRVWWVLFNILQQAQRLILPERALADA